MLKDASAHINMRSGVRAIFRKCSYFYHSYYRHNFIEIHNIRGIKLPATLNRQNYRSPYKYTKYGKVSDAVDPVQHNEKVNLDSDDSELDHLLDRSLYIRECGHQVLVIQPYIKWGRERKILTTPELQLAEAVTLIKTLRNWTVVDEMLISLLRLNRPRLFGSGQLDNLKEIIQKNLKITALFISVNMLTTGQQIYLQNFFQLPIYDRYTIVIHIFREHAATREAKLQIKLAELPYLWSRMKNIGKGSYANFGSGSSVFDSAWKGKEFHKMLLKQREAKIKSEIMKLREQRKNLKKSRILNEIPTVAVVGYTNSGKTSLIKALTGKDKLEPQDYLFATLDVTAHEGTLPCSMKVFFVDTIGFMSDLPTLLFESFVATLEDVKLADVVIHVRDISHPDNISQNENVLQTLKLLGVEGESCDHIITVGNKIDLMQKEELDQYRDDEIVFVSAKKMIGTEILLQKVEEFVLKSTGRKFMVMKVKTGGEEYSWLHEWAVVVDESPFAENNQYSLLKVILTDIALARFKHKFINDYFKQRKRG